MSWTDQSASCACGGQQLDHDDELLIDTRRDPHLWHGALACVLRAALLDDQHDHEHDTREEQRMYVTRALWGARKPKPGPGRLDPSQVIGLALHWPAMSGRIATGTAARAALRSWQAHHMDTNGWSDIAYQEAIDQLGNVYRLRGLRTQSGANGNEDVNSRYGALLLILGPDEQPSPKMVTAVRRRVARHRKLFPNSEQLVGHGSIRPGGSECPGPAVRAAMRAGTFRPR